MHRWLAILLLIPLAACASPQDDLNAAFDDYYFGPAASSGFDVLAAVSNIFMWVDYSTLGEGAIGQFTNMAPGGPTFTATGDAQPTNRPGEGLWFSGNDWYTNTPPVALQSNMFVAFVFSRTNTGAAINQISLGNVAGGAPYATMLYGSDSKPYCSLGNSGSTPPAYTNLGLNTVIISWRTNQTQYTMINGVTVSTNGTGSTDPRTLFLTAFGRRGSQYMYGPIKAAIGAVSNAPSMELLQQINTYLSGR